MSTLGDNMKHLREYHNLTQKFVGELVGVDATTIGRYEHGTSKPSTAQVTVLAEYFKVPVDLLSSGGEITLNMPNAANTQVSNGHQANLHQHVVSEEFVKQMMEQYTSAMRDQYATMMKDVHQLVQVVAQTSERSIQMMEFLSKKENK